MTTKLALQQINTKLAADNAHLRETLSEKNTVILELSAEIMKLRAQPVVHTAPSSRREAMMQAKQRAKELGAVVKV
jgi:chemotaxis protein histidine kinase CheA